MRAPLTAKALRELHARRLAGERTAVLAAEVGRTERGLRERWRRLGWWTPLGATVTITMTDEKPLRSLHARYANGTGESLASLARAYGTTPDRLARRWHGLGLRVVGRRGPASKPDPDLRAALVAHHDGRTWPEVWASLAEPKRWASAHSLRSLAWKYAHRHDLVFLLDEPKAPRAVAAK